MKTKNTSRNLYVRGNTVNPFAAAGPDKAGNERYWRWGSDNLFPNALALMSRRSPTHRRIINDKADYISGKGFTCDPERRTLAAIAERANGAGESLRVILNKLAFDKSLFGNAFLEIATDPDETSLSLFHQDASRCRVARDGTHILLHHDWTTHSHCSRPNRCRSTRYSNRPRTGRCGRSFIIKTTNRCSNTTDCQPTSPD